ncbi:uncharacterized protein E0L32_000475 [Thyridium curvatum]|uniref:Uncharacterized protein n=1 Tax=Thyridium curvatum TaxID=1093900 RepID=A0A507BAI3_9PEZI|nr:uncharacterized protein E0L32_000475 [Thyridium curvatum]TPX14081.1 hypothetical protein E0L32_000475 [Thyridium curvatum]
MLFKSATILRSVAALLLLIATGVAQAAQCGNVTISSASDADEVRKQCTALESLRFSNNLTESVNLDGIETVGFVYQHDDCWGGDGEQGDCRTVPPFSISSSTLTNITRGLEFGRFVGLRELSLPNLASVEGDFRMGRMHQLEVIDITKLVRVGSLMIEAYKLKTIRHERLDELTSTFGVGGVSLWDVGSVDSVDSFFKNPIRSNETDLPPTISLRSATMPKVRAVTIGWSRLASLSIIGDDVSVTLGGGSTDSIEIDEIKLMGNFSAFRRHPSVKNLTVGSFKLEASKTMPTEIDLPFDQVSNISLYNNEKLQTINSTPKAVGWNLSQLSIYYNPSLSLDSENRPGLQWYWPRDHDLWWLAISDTNISNAFFTSFLGYHAASDGRGPKVLGSFDVEPRYKQPLPFNCTPFSDLKARGVFPGHFRCLDQKANGAALTTIHSYLAMATMLLTALLALI